MIDDSGTDIPRRQRRDGGPALVLLRDWFAGQYVAGRVARTPDLTREDIAKAAYAMADAMLKARDDT